MKLLVLLSRVPYPLEKGDKLRAYHLMVRLARKHEVILCCLSDTATDPEHIAHLKQFCTYIEVVRVPRWRILLKLVGGLFSRLPFQVAYFHHGNSSFLLQDFCVEDHIKNFMMHLLVENVDDWHQRITESGLANKYKVEVSAVELQPWRMRDFTLVDPSGVLRRIAENVK